ncbi:MAG: hypothetical protein Q7K33_02075 [Candidatus Berkelbacteria bacterium]|nr:hypothetical protein [Candidatus Berkelbacteria bacterium]
MKPNRIVRSLTYWLLTTPGPLALIGLIGGTYLYVVNPNSATNPNALRWICGIMGVLFAALFFWSFGDAHKEKRELRRIEPQNPSPTPPLFWKDLRLGAALMILGSALFWVCLANKVAILQSSQFSKVAWIICLFGGFIAGMLGLAMSTMRLADIILDRYQQRWRSSGWQV